MPEPRDIPCPHCGVPMSLPLAAFFPSRRYPVVCPHCRGLGRVPYKVVAEGIFILLGVMILLFVLLDLTGLPRADAIPTILVLGVALAAIAFFSSHVCCLYGRYRITYFDRDVRKPEPKR